MKYLLALTLIALFFSCRQTKKNSSSIDISKVQATIIEVELKDSSSFFLLLVRDGTINRKGDLKNVDKNFFMGRSNDNLFEKLMQTATTDLFSYCDKVHVLADTTKPVNKIKMGFSGEGIETGFEYYTDDSVDKLPKPILDFINNAIQITDPWFKKQQDMIKVK